MNEVYEEDRSFENIDFTIDRLPVGEYEACTFVGCNFAETDMSGIVFSDCEMTGCNLAMARLSGASLRDVRFKDCKLLGVRFYECTEFLFAVNFDNCQLDLSSFYNLKIKNTQFKDSSIREVDFSGADLTKAKFENCDLSGATFESSVIEKADFRLAYNYGFDPDVNRIKGAKFSREGVAGLLNKYDIEID